MAKKILIYNHGGSRNHGCEALVRTVINNMPEDFEITLMSDAPEEDMQYGINMIVKRIISSTASYSKLSPDYIRAYSALKFRKDCYC